MKNNELIRARVPQELKEKIQKEMKEKNLTESEVIRIRLMESYGVAQKVDKPTKLVAQKSVSTTVEEKKEVPAKNSSGFDRFKRFSQGLPRVRY